MRGRCINHRAIDRTRVRVGSYPVRLACAGRLRRRVRDVREFIWVFRQRWRQREDRTDSSGPGVLMARKKAATKAGTRRSIRCYLCGHVQDVSTRTMSTTCPGCNRAIKVEDVTVKSYLPVNDLQTCGEVTITKRGRVVAKRIQSGEGISCEGAMEGTVETDGPIELGAKSSWKGQRLVGHSLVIQDGATLLGRVTIPWNREQDEKASE
ncbi:MAG: polymer-forming cytoskeletal protein [Phycisphaerales bacterium]|nr:MAG: polymer-forming cytoskeletal protein [Phycisphaerales bacterium]